VTHWIVLDVPDGLETETAIEVRRLKAMRRQHHLGCPARAGFVFGGGHEARAQALSPPLFMHPECLHLTTVPPSPAIESRNNVVVTVPKDDREQSAIRDASSRHIVLIETVIEKLDVMTIWRIEDGEPLKMQRIIWRCHLFSPPVVSTLPNI
jgi:hypothetical protein